MSGPALTCAHRHPYTPENTLLVQDHRGYLHQRCRTCNRDQQRARRAAARPQVAEAAWTPPPLWTEAALCATADPEAWFADQDDPQTIAAAKAICSRCPGRTECLALALARGEEHGIWGGLDAAERAALAAGRRTAA